MTFLVFIMAILFFTVFWIHSGQVHRMDIVGAKAWSQFPPFLVRKMSDLVYTGSTVLFGWLLIVVGGLIANANADKLVQTYPGMPWAAVYFFFIALVYGALWLKNRSIELKS